MKLFLDMSLLFGRHVTKTARTPMWLFIGLLQPILYLLLYMPLLKNMSQGPGQSGATVVAMFTPGMLVVMGMGALFAGFSFIDEIRIGIISRWLVTPTPRISILLSLVFSNLVTLFLQCVILLVVAYFFGLDVPFLGILLTMALVMMIGMCMAAASYAISLSVQDEGALASITNTFYLPVMLLSGIMLPIAIAPDWIKSAAKFNPFYYVVEASRCMFAGDYSDNFVWQGFLIMTAFTAFTMWLALRALKKMAA
jgi:ABC-2 type transport system permease protein